VSVLMFDFYKIFYSKHISFLINALAKIKNLVK